MIQTDQVNIANYARVEYNPKDITFEWEEMRDVFVIVVHCSDPSALAYAKIQYWQRVWPNQRVPKGAIVGAGGSGWMADDDPYNGEWKTADAKVTLQGDNAVYTFNPINAVEFPDIEGFDASYRRTLKLRIMFDGKRPEIDSIEVYSDSVWKETEIKIEWGDVFADNDWHGRISVYNGELVNIQPITGNIQIKTDKSWKSNKSRGSIKAIVRFAHNDDVNSYDKTIVTMRTTANSFSFLVDEIVAGEKIFVKDFDVLVTKATDNIDYAQFCKEWESSHVKTLYDRIKELPEQTYLKSWNDMPKKKKRGFMPMGCDGGRQKFAVDQNGDVFYTKNYAARVKGKDTDRLLWNGNDIRYRFGFPDVEPTKRHRLDGYLPMIYAKWDSGNISYEQTAFVTLLEGDILSGESMQGDDPTVLLAKVTLSNSSNNPQDVSLRLTSWCSIEETPGAKNGFIFATNYESERMRYYLDTMNKGSLVSENNGLSYKLTLAGRESHSVYFKIPFITLTENDPILPLLGGTRFETLRKIDYESELPRVKKFWEDRVAQGTQITIPNDILNNFYKTIYLIISIKRISLTCLSLTIGKLDRTGTHPVSELSLMVCFPMNQSCA